MKEETINNMVEYLSGQQGYRHIPGEIRRPDGSLAAEQFNGQWKPKNIQAHEVGGAHRIHMPIMEYLVCVYEGSVVPERILRPGGSTAAEVVDGQWKTFTNPEELRGFLSRSGVTVRIERPNLGQMLAREAL